MAVFALPTTRASAHGYLIRTIPTDGAVFERSPVRVQAWFSESLEPRFSTVTVTDERGTPIPPLDVSVSPTNSTQLVARLPKGLPNGAYVVRVRGAFASDGHVLSESFVFWVGEPSGGLTSSDEARGPIWLEVAWRAVGLPALHVLVGVLLLYQMVLLPAWGNPRYPAGGLPPRVMNRLALVLWVALAITALSSVLAVLQYTMTLFAADAQTVLRDGLWNVVMATTQIGELLRQRFLLIAAVAGLLGAAAYLATRAPVFVTPLWAVALICALLLLVTLSNTSHAAGATLWTLQSVLVDWLHIAATSAWVGGLVGLSVVVPAALHPLADEARAAALRAVLRRFSPLAVLAVALLAVTGIFSATIQVEAAADVPGSPYGLTLIAKVVLVAPLLLLGWLHQRRVRAAVDERLPRLLGTVRLEAFLGLPVLLAAALLSSTPPPVPSAPAAAVPITQGVPVGDLWVHLALEPNAVGANTYEAALTEAGRPLEGATVWLRLVLPALDRRTRLLPLDELGGGLYGNAGTELTRAGAWVAAVDVIGADGQVRRAAFRWDVPPVPDSSGERQPTLVNWGSAAGVVTVLAAWVLPPFWRRLRTLKLQREGVIIGTFAAAVTLLLFALGGWMLTTTAARNDLLRNPPSALMNAAFPDADSVARGRETFAQHCTSCHRPDNATGRLTFGRRLDELNDEQVFRALRNADHGSVAESLRDSERWDVVNYLRSAAFATPSTP
jgi:copper transport protein